jgi:hypothetical protein
MCQQWACDSFDYLLDDERMNFDKNGKKKKRAPFLPFSLSLSHSLFFFSWMAVKKHLPGWSARSLGI